MDVQNEIDDVNTVLSVDQMSLSEAESTISFDNVSTASTPVNRLFKESTKKKVQLTFENITIKTIPRT